jgi:hypothetical protein
MQYLYKQFTHILVMSELIWKCFRCNLSFKDDNLAEMHKNISNHSVTKVKSLVA